MRELKNFELLSINGGEWSFAKKAGYFVAEFVAVTAACVVWVADCTVDVIQTVL